MKKFIIISLIVCSLFFALPAKADTFTQEQISTLIVQIQQQIADILAQIQEILATQQEEQVEDNSGYVQENEVGGASSDVVNTEEEQVEDNQSVKKYCESINRSYNEKYNRCGPRIVVPTSIF